MKYNLTISIVIIFCYFTKPLLAENGVILNGRIWHDTNGHQMWCNGGHMIQQGEKFYWVGYETKPHTGFRNIKLYSSTNLADWKFENNILRNEDSLTVLSWAGRPALLYNWCTDNYILVFEAGSERWYRHKVRSGSQALGPL
jgi:hypothetical protein